MKKIRRVLSIIIAAAMVMSMSALCFIATAETVNGSAAFPNVTAWEFDISVGEVGSAATLVDGPFSLASSAGTLSGTVTEYNYTASIVTDGGERAFSKSPGGIIDITPAMSTTSQIIFTAPEAGVYYYDVSVVITSTTVRAGLWTQIGKYNNGYNSTDPAWGYSSAAITNGDYDGWLYNTNKLDAAKTVTLAKGETLILSVEADAGDNGKTNTDETQLTVNRFNVVKVPDGTDVETFACSIGTPDAPGKIEEGNFKLGTIYNSRPFELVDGTALVNAWGDVSADNADASPGYWGWQFIADEVGGEVKNNRLFITTTTGRTDCIMDMSPKHLVPAVIMYTAQSDGVYCYNSEFYSVSTATGVIMTVATGTGRVTDLGECIGEYVMSASEPNYFRKTETVVGGQTYVYSGTVELKAGQTILFIAENNKRPGYESGIPSPEIGVKSISVIRVADHVCHEFEGADCQTAGTCVLCGVGGGKDSDNHTQEPVYTDNNDGATHTVAYNCCGSYDTEAHDFTSGDCVCGAKVDVTGAEFAAALTTAIPMVPINTAFDVNIEISGEAGKYSSGQIEISYDPNVFTFDQSSSTLPAVMPNFTATEGKISFSFVGDENAFGSSKLTVATLSFTGTQYTDASNIVLEKAAFSTSEGAVNSGLVTAAKYNEKLAVSVTPPQYNVTLDSSLSGNRVVVQGEKYTFAPNSAYYDYDTPVVVVDTNNDGTFETDVSASVTKDGDTWTVPGASVTGDLKITVSRTAKKYNVTVVDSEGNDVSATWIKNFNSTATYLTDYTFEVIADTWTETAGGMKYELQSVKIGDTSYDFDENSKTNTILGEDIIEEITITIAGNNYDPIAVAVNFDGTGKDAAEADAKIAYLDSDYVFYLAGKEDGWIYTVKYKIGTSGSEKDLELTDGKYTVPKGELTDTVYVTVNRVSAISAENISVHDYLTLQGGSKMWLVLVKAEKLTGSHYVIDVGGESEPIDMFWSGRDNAYCCLVIADSLTAEQAAAYTYSVVSGAADEIEYDMNVNMSDSGKVDANDAQLVYNMYSAKDDENAADYAGFTVVSMEKFLRADVNNDNEVDIGDVAAICEKVCGDIIVEP